MRDENEIKTVEEVARKLIAAQNMAMSLFVMGDDSEIDSVGGLLTIVHAVAEIFISDYVISDQYIHNTDNKKVFLNNFIRMLQSKLAVIEACETKGAGIIDAIKNLGAKADAN